MKKMIALLLLFAITLSLAACGSAAPESTNGKGNTTEPDVVTEPSLSMEEYGATVAIDFLKSIVPNPQRFDVLSLRYAPHYQKEDQYIYEVEYTAENRQGGSDRQTVYIQIDVQEDGSGGITGNVNKKFKSNYSSSGLAIASTIAEDIFSETASQAQTLNIEKVLNGQ